ncbi:glycosyltransferase family 4 protein [Psychromonas sp. KJ10-10]|uniref:glycosyltransferase family 4 protein n=1 Tax=Psychromonas sp. KJ10-10 TaxID=3391823 RepID=UPI0039B50F46
MHSSTTILFTHYGDNWIRGSERCLLDLLCHLDKQKFTPILWCNQPILEAQAKKLGIIVYRSDFPLLLGWNAPRFNLKGFTQLLKTALKIIDKHQIKLLHANSAAPCQWLNFAARKRKLPLLCHLHSSYQLRDRLSLGLYQVNMAVGVSEYVLDGLKKDNLPKARHCVIANGIDQQQLLNQPAQALGNLITLDKEDFVLATVGSLIERKGVDLIISAVAKLINKGFSLRLIIIGDGPQRSTLETQINKLSMAHKITLLGEQHNVHGILREHVDAFISGAREEAFGLVLAEASLAKIPVIAPAVGGIPDVVIDGKTGILIPSEDVDAMAEAISELYFHPETCQNMANAGYHHVLEHFTITKNSKRFEQLYENMLTMDGNKNKMAHHWSLALSLKSALKSIFNKGLSMSHKAHLLIIDPIAFSGGSKIATESILRQLDTNKTRISVLSADSDSWLWPELKRVKLYQPQWLARQEQGIAYFISHFFIMLQILLLRIRLGHIDMTIGASGPGVDLSLYLIKPFLSFNIIQLIHGPVASSNTIARCLTVSEQIFYLPSTRSSLLNCLSYFHSVNIDKLPAHYQIMENGLCDTHWPTPCTKQPQAVVFWARFITKMERFRNTTHCTQ